MSNAERRHFPRKALEDLACIEIVPDNGGIILNVSYEGLCFQSVAPVQRCSPLRFSLLAQSLGKQTIIDCGELIWTDEAQKFGGLRFTSLSPEARRKVNEWIGRLDAEANPTEITSGLSEVIPLGADLTPAVAGSMAPVPEVAARMATVVPGSVEGTPAVLQAARRVPNVTAPVTPPVPKVTPHVAASFSPERTQVSTPVAEGGAPFCQVSAPVASAPVGVAPVEDTGASKKELAYVSTLRRAFIPKPVPKDRFGLATLLSKFSRLDLRARLSRIPAVVPLGLALCALLGAGAWLATSLIRSGQQWVSEFEGQNQTTRAKSQVSALSAAPASKRRSPSARARVAPSAIASIRGGKQGISVAVSPAFNESLDATPTERVRLRATPERYSFPASPDPALTGKVRLNVMIAKDGSVTDVQVLSGDPVLADASVRAVRRWRYRPPEVNGRAAIAETSLTVTFMGDAAAVIEFSTMK